MPGEQLRLETNHAMPGVRSETTTHPDLFRATRTIKQLPESVCAKTRYLLLARNSLRQSTSPRDPSANYPNRRLRHRRTTRQAGRVAFADYSDDGDNDELMDSVIGSAETVAFNRRIISVSLIN